MFDWTERDVEIAGLKCNIHFQKVKFSIRFLFLLNSLQFQVHIPEGVILTGQYRYCF